MVNFRDERLFFYISQEMIPFSTVHSCIEGLFPQCFCTSSKQTYLIIITRMGQNEHALHTNSTT